MQTIRGFSLGYVSEMLKIPKQQEWAGMACGPGRREAQSDTCVGSMKNRATFFFMLSPKSEASDKKKKNIYERQ